MTSQIGYTGTSGKDTISTYELQKLYPSNLYGFKINGLDGDDTLRSSFIGRNGVDDIRGGKGDDFMSLSSSYLSPKPLANVAGFFGDFGTDRLYVILREGDYVSPFNVNKGLINFSIISSRGEKTIVEVSYTTEAISIGDLTYLTEDLAGGRVRAVSWDEQWQRTYGSNADWAVKGLNTYDQYHYSQYDSQVTTDGKEEPKDGNTNVIIIGDNNTIGDINVNLGNGVVNTDEWTGNVFFSLPSTASISDITKQWFGSTNIADTKAQVLDINTDPQLLDVATKTWSKKVKVNKIVQASNNGDTIRAEAPEKFVPAIGSVLNGGQARDIVEGRIGWDIIDGGDGSDFIHGGNGRDVITGGAGGDELWGDFGLNTFKSEKDGQKDLVVIKSDHYVYNWLNNSYTNNPNGERTDFIEGLDSWDRIRVTGGYKQDLRFAENVTHMGQTGIAIYLKDSLEALYTGNDLSLDQIKNMTDGDGSEAAIANSVHQYGLDWL